LLYKLHIALFFRAPRPIATLYAMQMQQRLAIRMRSFIDDLDCLQPEVLEEGGGDGNIGDAEDRAVDGSRLVVRTEKTPRLRSAAMAFEPGIEIRPAGDLPALRHPVTASILGPGQGGVIQTRPTAALCDGCECIPKNSRDSRVIDAFRLHPHCSGVLCVEKERRNIARDFRPALPV